MYPALGISQGKCLCILHFLRKLAVIGKLFVQQHSTQTRMRDETIQHGKIY